MFHLEDFHVHTETGLPLSFLELPLSSLSMKTVPASFSLLPRSESVQDQDISPWHT